MSAPPCSKPSQAYVLQKRREAGVQGLSPSALTAEQKQRFNAAAAALLECDTPSKEQLDELSSAATPLYAELLEAGVTKKLVESGQLRVSPDCAKPLAIRSMQLRNVNVAKSPAYKQLAKYAQEAAPDEAAEAGNNITAMIEKLIADGGIVIDNNKVIETPYGTLTIKAGTDILIQGGGGSVQVQLRPPATFLKFDLMLSAFVDLSLVVADDVQIDLPLCGWGWPRPAAPPSPPRPPRPATPPPCNP